MPKTFSLTSTKPIWYVTIITLGCPFNHVNDFGYSRKYLSTKCDMADSQKLLKFQSILTLAVFDFFQIDKYIKIMFTTTILAGQSF